MITGERLSILIEACKAADSLTRKMKEPLLKKLADSLVHKAGADRFFLKDKIVGPLLTVGKLDQIVTLAGQNINLLDLALPVLKQLSESIKTDYEVCRRISGNLNWSSRQEQQRWQMLIKTINMWSSAICIWNQSWTSGRNQSF